MTVLSFWQHFDSSTITESTIETYAPRMGIVCFNAWESSYISSFKAANPNVKCYVYKDFSSTRSFDPGPNNETSGALLYSSTLSAHPSWFMTKSGTPVTWSGFPDNYQMLIGLAAYQNAAVAAVISDAQTNGWDGIYMDNILYSLSQYGNTTNDQYANDTAFQAAYVSLFENVCPKLIAAGFGCIGNMAGIRVDNPLWETYMAAGMTGGFDQYWIDFSANSHGVPEFGNGSGSSYVSTGFIAQLTEATSNTSSNQIFMGQSQSQSTDTSTQGFRYAFAAYNLVVQSGLTMFAENTGESGPPYWRPEYNYNLGTPEGAYTEPQNLVYQRTFTAGMAIANANTTGSVNITLPNTYVTEDGVSITSLSLAAEFGVTLQLQGSTGGGGTSSGSGVYTPLVVPTLPDFYAGYTVQAADLDNIAYACGFLVEKPLTRAYDSSGGQTIANGSGSTLINFTEITFDIDGMYDSAFPNQLTIQTPGWYKLRYGVNCGTTASANFNAFALVNAGPNNPGGPGQIVIYGSSASNCIFNFLSAAGIIPTYLFTGDYIQIGVRTSTSGTLTTSVTGYNGSDDAGSFCCLEYVSTT